MKVNIDTKGLEKAIDQIKAWEITKLNAVKDVINESALNIQKGAMRRCPVDTGRLRSSIAMQPATSDGLTLQVGSKLQYAPYVEFGTGKFVDIPAAANIPGVTGRQKPWKFTPSKGGVEGDEMVWTSGQKPQPFLFPASEDEKTNYITALKGALGK